MPVANMKLRGEPVGGPASVPATGASVLVADIVAATDALDAIQEMRSAHDGALLWRTTKRSAVRSDSAMMVSAGFTDSALGKTELSQMCRPGTSKLRPSGSTTARESSRPIRHVPATWA